VTAPPAPTITYDIPTAAELIGCSVTWLTREIRAKRVPHSKFGNNKRLTEEHLRAIAAMQTVQPVAPVRTDTPTRFPARRRKPA
jgi:hypothetical protein